MLVQHRVIKQHALWYTFVMIYTILGISSALIFIAGDIPYILDTIKGKTQPQRVTWGVVTVLNLISFANQLASGAGNSLWLFGAATIITGIITVLSITKGVGGHSRLDIFAMVTSALGVILWIIFDSPLISVIVTASVALISLIPSYVKAKKDPDSETRISWLVGSFSAALAAVSVGELDIELLILPLNAVVLQLYMSYLLYVDPGQSR